MTNEEWKKSQEEWNKAEEVSQQIRAEVTSELVKILDDMRKQYLKLSRDVKPFSLEYWTRKNDIKALGFIVSCLEEYTTSGKCDRVHSGLCNLYVMDKTTKQIWRVGERDHDSLCTNLGYVDYYNMQCGDGGGVDSDSGYGYTILQSEHGSLTNEYGIIDRKYENEIRAYLLENGYTEEDIDGMRNRE